MPGLGIGVGLIMIAQSRHSPSWVTRNEWAIVTGTTGNVPFADRTCRVEVASGNGGCGALVTCPGAIAYTSRGVIRKACKYERTGEGIAGFAHNGFSVDFGTRKAQLTGPNYTVTFGIK